MKRRICSAFFVYLLLVCFSAESVEISAIRQIITKSRLNPPDLGILISDGNREVFSLNPAGKFIPASVSKVITGAATLELLGAKYQFRTQLLYDGSMVDNTIRGSIYLRAGGDPSFHSGKLPTLYSGLKKHKIKTIEGDLFIDDFRFEDVTMPEWKSHIQTLNPQSFPLFVRLDPIQTLLLAQKQNGIYKKLTNLEGRFVVYENLIEPDLRTGQLFLQMMQKNGVRLKGKLKRGRVAKSARVLTEIVTPSTRLISHVLKTSNNFYADLLVRNISVAFGERPGTYGTGIDFLTFYLDHVNVPRSEYTINSGSGFSHHNMISPRAIVQLLTHLKNNKETATTFNSFLPIAGVDGTLAGRMRGTSAQGRVRAKTGYLRPVRTKTQQLDGSVTLAGYASPLKKGSTPFTFAFLYNGNAAPDLVKNTFDQMCAQIVGPLPPQPKKPKKVKSASKKKEQPAKRKAKSKRSTRKRS